MTHVFAAETLVGMTDSSAIIPKPRVVPPQISALAWEHPADRAALNTVRAIPAIDDVLKKSKKSE